jgi:hypothetical protein
VCVQHHNLTGSSKPRGFLDSKKSRLCLLVCKWDSNGKTDLPGFYFVSQQLYYCTETQAHISCRQILPRMLMLVQMMLSGLQEAWGGSKEAQTAAQMFKMAQRLSGGIELKT